VPPVVTMTSTPMCLPSSLQTCRQKKQKVNLGMGIFSEFPNEEIGVEKCLAGFFDALHSFSSWNSELTNKRKNF
jgi:hypothetical protein